MNKTLKTQDVVLAALLTACSMLITFSPLKLVTPAFTLTLGSHVPTMLAMFINPVVAVMTVVGSCIGFFLVFPMPQSIIVIARAASHLIFAFAGMQMLKKNMNIFAVIIITSLLHAGAEALLVMILTPIFLINNDKAIWTLGATTFGGTIVHHFIDCAITAPILTALRKAKLIKTNLIFTKR